MLQTVLMCIGLELAIVWVLRERTSLLRRTSVVRLFYVAGAGTLVSQPVSSVFIHDLSARWGLLVALAVLCLGVIVFELVLYRFMGRIGWRKATLFSVCANLASFLVLAVLYSRNAVRF